MTLIWYQSFETGPGSPVVTRGGRTGRPLLKSFSITEEREAIVLQKSLLMVRVLTLKRIPSLGLTE